MAITRREFLKYSAVTGAALTLGIFDIKPIEVYAQTNPPVWETLTHSICCYCGVGCGLLVGTPSDRSTATYVQGNPDSPINQGALCSKGQALVQIRTVDGALNPKRLLTPKRRLPNATEWTDVSWDVALNDIAAKIKATRDGINPDTGGPNTITEELINAVLTPVNRNLGIACLGGAALDNEECYLLAKLMRSLGVVYLEHQARL
jgi:formate dehydrogenase major subunit